jgi:hypothetical protein
MSRILFFIGLIFLNASTAVLAETEAKGKVRYKEGQAINFENLLIQGQLQKPNLTVVTGDVKQGGDGLLRIRKNFLDRMAEDFGEDEK